MNNLTLNNQNIQNLPVNTANFAPNPAPQSPQMFQAPQNATAQMNFAQPPASFNQMPQMQNGSPQIGILTPPSPSEILPSDKYQSAETNQKPALPKIKNKKITLAKTVLFCQAAVAVIGITFAAISIPKAISKFTKLFKK